MFRPLPFLAFVFSLTVASPNSHAGGEDYEYQVRFEPKQPTIGDSYRMYIQVWNNNKSHALVFRASILKLPEGDKLLAARDAEKRVEPGGSHTFRFDIYCGSETGSVTYSLTAGWK